MITSEDARTCAEMWTTHDSAKRETVLARAKEGCQQAAVIALAIDQIYGPKNGPTRVREFLRLLTVH